jgi:hypothetical protein
MQAWALVLKVQPQRPGEGGGSQIQPAAAILCLPAQPSGQRDAVSSARNGSKTYTQTVIAMAMPRIGTRVITVRTASTWRAGRRRDVEKDHARGPPKSAPTLPPQHRLAWAFSLCTTSVQGDVSCLGSCRGLGDDVVGTRYGTCVGVC